MQLWISLGEEENLKVNYSGRYIHPRGVGVRTFRIPFSTIFFLLLFITSLFFLSSSSYFSHFLCRYRSPLEMYGTTLARSTWRRDRFLMQKMLLPAPWTFILDVEIAQRWGEEGCSCICFCVEAFHA